MGYGLINLLLLRILIMTKILITSVGSLVGQNILDVLELRRKNIQVIGMNSVAENQRNFRCDRVYLVPPTDLHGAFEEAFDHIFKIEKPDFVLAGRDIDVVFLAEYKEKHSEIGNTIPCGHSWIAKILYDKYDSFLFARQYDLPFADTFLYTSNKDFEALKQFTALHAFPLIVKPRHGFGSLNVFFVTDNNQLYALAEKNKEFIIQEYLCPDKNFATYLDQYTRGLPLFFQIPEQNHFVSQIVISPEKEILGVFSSKHTLVGGKAESSIIYKNEAIEELVQKYLNVLVSAGWKGSLNIQYKPDINGIWKVFEMNPRMVGASSSRMLLGFDELGMLINSFKPEIDFPLIVSNNKQNGTVLKYLTDHYLDADHVEELSKNKVWNKN